MRVLCLLFLVAFTAAIVLFVAENHQEVIVSFWNRSLPTSLASVVGAAFALGMLTGWSIVGLVRRSLHRMTEQPEAQQRHAGR
jgi:membrane protein YqaA with SNARE-associated domain